LVGVRVRARVRYRVYGENARGAGCDAFDDAAIGGALEVDVVIVVQVVAP
jgi:hypothetical protein